MNVRTRLLNVGVAAILAGLGTNLGPARAGTIGPVTPSALRAPMPLEAVRYWRGRAYRKIILHNGGGTVTVFHSPKKTIVYNGPNKVVVYHGPFLNYGVHYAWTTGRHYKLAGYSYYPPYGYPFSNHSGLDSTDVDFYHSPYVQYSTSPFTGYYGWYGQLSP